jgi:hypothetical protein
MKTIMVILISEDWADASRVLASASSPSRTFSNAPAFPAGFGNGKNCCGETPQPTRETRALPREFPFWTWFIDNPSRSLASRQ